MRAAHDLAAARTFYIGLLRGTLVHAARRHTDAARLLFRIGDVLVETLIDWGVDTIFGIPGDGINGVFEALRTRQEKVRLVQVRHE